MSDKTFTLTNTKNWEEFFNNQDTKKELENISNFLSLKTKENIVYYPPDNLIFRVFQMKPEDIKLIILGMDPYHDGNATGLCFSINPLLEEGKKKINPSLKNIYEELKSEGFSVKETGCLEHWFNQGCFMLNTALTVQKGKPGSHINIWKKFTSLLINFLLEKTDAAWLLMGNHAISFSDLIESKKDQKSIFKTTHPSPLGARKNSKKAKAFIGSNVFNEINNYLFLKILKKIAF